MAVKEVVQEGYQFPLPIEVDVIDLVKQELLEGQKRERKAGLLTRVWSGMSIGVLLDHKRQIEEGFKVGSLRERVYFYDTQAGRQTVLATPEDIQAEINRRRSKRYPKVD